MNHLINFNYIFNFILYDIKKFILINFKIII